MQSLLSSDEFKQIQDYCDQRYGVEAHVWENFTLVKRKEGLWLTPKELGIGVDESMHGKLNQLKDLILRDAQSVGLRILSGREYPYKVTAQFYHVLHPFIDKGLVSLSEYEAKDLLKRKTICGEHLRELRKGYYFCLFSGKFIGIAHKTDEGLVSQVPKSFTAQLAKDLKLSDE